MEPDAAKLLGEFLAARRRSLEISRKEACASVGASATWYAWLEQGRAPRPSPELLERVVTLLRLRPFEKRLVRHLAARLAIDDELPKAVSAPMVRLLEHVEPCPAYVLNARRDLLAYNRSVCDVYVDLDRLPRSDHNLLWLLMTNRTVRARLVNWEASARRAISTFRAARMSAQRPASFDPLVERLLEASREFRVWWKTQELHPSDISDDHVEHPDVGRLVLTNTPLVAGDDPGLIVLLVTADPQTGTLAKLHELAERRGRRPAG